MKKGVPFQNYKGYDFFENCKSFFEGGSFR